MWLVARFRVPLMCGSGGRRCGVAGRERRGARALGGVIGGLGSGGVRFFCGVVITGRGCGRCSLWVTIGCGAWSALSAA